MKTSTLELLESSQLPPAQARAILQAMEAELTVRDGVLATRSELFAVKDELKGMIQRLELKIEGLRSEIRATEVRVIRWNFLFWITQLGAVAALVKGLK